VNEAFVNLPLFWFSALQSGFNPTDRDAMKAKDKSVFGPSKQRESTVKLRDFRVFEIQRRIVTSPATLRKRMKSLHMMQL
jgi:CRISPR/Cas system CMR-associated protein Cmr1 (group 7 of RAMP superfamily)